MCAIPINWYDWDWGESEEKNLSRLLYRICDSGVSHLLCSELHVPDRARSMFLPHASDPAPRPEAAEPVGQLAGRGQTGRLRTGQDVRLRAGGPGLHTPRGHSLVPRSRTASGRQDLQHRGGRLVSRLEEIG